MAKKKRRQRYGDYCEIIDGQLYASVNIPLGDGRYKRKRKKVESRTDARNWALAELDKAKHGDTQQGDLSTFGKLAEWYKTHFLTEPVYERGIKVSGVKSWKRYRDDLDRMLPDLGSKALAHFTEKDLRAYTRLRRERDKVGQVTINRDMALLRTMFRKGHAADKSITVPHFPINLAAEKHRERVMTQDEEQRLYAVCTEYEEIEYTRKGKTVKAKHKTNREHLPAVVTIAVDTAMRKFEIFSLLWSDLDLEKGIITIRPEVTKTGKGRTVGMTARVKEAFLSLPNTGPEVFPYVDCDKAFNTACERAEIKDLTFHDLRHTATTRMVRAGIPHTEIMKITGHSQISTFLRYLNPEEDTVQTAAARLEMLLKKKE